jgi:arylsulfatase A-like enzyme
MTRRDLLKSAAISASLPLLGAQTSTAARRGKRGRGLGMNVVLFMTDQERAIQHFPPGWEEHNLHGMTRLKATGLTLENAFTNACMCSPARSTWMTGYFPAQHGVKYTLEEDLDDPEKYPQVELPLDLENIATVMSAAGYNVVLKGKWHCSKKIGGEWTPEDVGAYGFQRWNPPDAGANQDPKEAGGPPNGRFDNDGRFMNADGEEEGALAYLTNVAAEQQPFFLIVSLVNPHDVLLYPNRESFIEAGYDRSWLKGDIRLPITVAESLDTKPTVQKDFRDKADIGLGPLPSRQDKLNYINFYGNLMKSSDNYLVDILDTLDELGLRDDTLIIRTADHGEMGLAHGGLRQKNFNFYEESIRVPLIYSNPKLYPEPYSSDALVSHVDFLPTLAGLFDAPKAVRDDWQGVDYSNLVLHPSRRPVQDYVVFTYDDYQSGQSDPATYPQPPNHIISIREKRYKLAQYYDVNQNPDYPMQWEMYDLEEDPLEMTNLAFNLSDQPKRVQNQFNRLKRKLLRVQARRLQPLV